MDNNLIKEQKNFVSQQLQAGLQTIDDILFKNYIDNLKQYEIVPLDKSLIRKILKIKFVYLR